MNKRPRFELSDEELERTGAVCSGKVSSAAAAVQLLRAPRLVPDVICVVGQSLPDGITSNNLLISLIDADRACLAAPDAAARPRMAPRRYRTRFVGILSPGRVIVGQA